MINCPIVFNELPTATISDDVSICTGTNGDLTISLTSPSGTTAILIQSQCGADDDLMGDFDDLGGPIVCPPTTGGPFAPQDPFSVFNNEPITGTWTLTIADGANLDGGSLNTWSLELCGTIVENDECPTVIETFGTNAQFCDGSTTVIGATESSNITYSWTSSNPNIAILNPTSAVIELELSALTPCQIEIADISLVAICNIDGTELFNGSVGIIEVFPAPPADITSLVIVNPETCDDPVMVDPNCAAFVTLIPDAGNPTFPVAGGESGTASYTIIYAAPDPVRDPNCCPVVESNVMDIILDGGFESGGPGNGWTEFQTNLSQL